MNPTRNERIALIKLPPAYEILKKKKRWMFVGVTKNYRPPHDLMKLGCPTKGHSIHPPSLSPFFSLCIVNRTTIKPKQK
jgi:hypothetical protein